MTLSTVLGERLHGHVVVVGVGNPYRSDDGVGCRVAARLRAGGRVTTIDAEEIPESFLGDILSTQPDTVVFVDAVDLGAPPGAVALIDRDQLARRDPTTHRSSLTLLMELVATATGAEVLVVAIQPRQLELFGPMTPDVAIAAERVAALLEESLPGVGTRGVGVEGGP